LRAADTHNIDLAEVLGSVRQLLVGGTRPRGVSTAHWKAFQRFLTGTSDPDFLEFVRRVEWSTGTADPPTLTVNVRARLIELGIASDPVEAEAVHDRLFAYVWRLLTREGTKQLTTKDFVREVARPTLGVRDRVRIDTLYFLLAQLEGRVVVVEHGLTQLTGAHQALALDMRILKEALVNDVGVRAATLANDVGIRAAISYVAESPTLEEPPSVSPLSTRHTTVTSLLNTHKAELWWAVHGASGMGKSQLTLLLAKQSAATRLWIGFRDLNISQCALRLDAVVAKLLGSDKIEPVARDHVDRLAAALPKGASIVFDDLPHFSANDELGQRILTVVRACAAREVRVITTSIHRLPVSAAQLVPSVGIAEIATPPFTPEECRELFAAFGAPRVILHDQIAAIAVAVTGGHPVLVQALARGLKRQGWPTTGTDAFFALFNRPPDTAVNNETFHRILETVEDPSSRELLGRLTTADSHFDLADVRAIAGVDPVIGEPLAKLHLVEGLWLQAEGTDRYSLSPLVRALGATDVAADTIKGCHAVLARRLVGRERINSLEFLQAFTHFTIAGESKMAAILLLRALANYNRSPSPNPDRIILSLWVDTPLPSDLEPSLLMQVRAAQIRARKTAGLDTTSLEREFDALLGAATDGDAWAVFSATMLLLGNISKENVKDSVRYVRLALATWPGADREWRARGLPGAPVAIGSLVWLALPNRSLGELREWLDLVDAVPSELRPAAFSGSLAYDGAVEAVESLLRAEQERSTEPPRWESVLAALEEMEKRVDQGGTEVLWAAARSARITVYGELMQDVTTASDLAVASLERNLSPESRFLVAKTLGLIYLDAGNQDAAEGWLVRAADSRPAEYPSQYVLVALWAAVVVGRRDPKAALELATRGVSRARELESNELLTAVALAEGGLAYALSGDIERAFHLWDEAGERLFLKAATDREAAARLLTLTYPVSHFLVSSRDGARTEDPDQPIPPLGLMLRAKSKADASASDTERSLLALALARLGEALGADTRALVWAERAEQLASATGDTVMAGLVVPTIIVDAIDEGNEEDVLRRLRVAGTALHRGGMVSEAQTSLEQRGSVLGGDLFAMQCGLLPFALRLGTLRVRGLDARAPAERLVAACEAISRDRGDASVWRAAAMIVRSGFVEERSYRDLIDSVDTDPATDQHLSTALRCVAYLAASLDPEMTPAAAFRGHANVLSWMEPALSLHQRLYRATLTPFFLAYWRARLESGAFRFRNPRRLQRTLNSLAALPPRDSTRGLIRTLVESVGAALNAPLTPIEVEWLRPLPQAAINSDLVD
jgi:tetratricopeptide (TPR) repeat protein